MLSTLVPVGIVTSKCAGIAGRSAGCLNHPHAAIAHAATATVAEIATSDEVDREGAATRMTGIVAPLALSALLNSFALA
jgi:hypothetical protein